MNENQPLVSVVVAAYKAENYIAQCLDSLLAQTYKNLEILVVNDGSPDNTGEICDQYARKDGRIRVFHKENGGVSSARNVALANATGKYLTFCDSDDMLCSFCVETLVNNAIENNCQVSLCALHRWPDRSITPTGPTLSSIPLMVMSVEEAVGNMLIHRHFGGYSGGLLLERSLLDGIFFNESIHLDEDHLFTIEAVLHANKVCFTKTAMYHYYTNPNGAAHSGFHAKYLTVTDACEKIEEVIRSAGKYPALRHYMDARYVYCHLLLLRRLHGNNALYSQYAPSFQKIVRRHLTLKSIRYLARSMQISGSLVCIHYKLYFMILDKKRK